MLSIFIIQYTWRFRLDAHRMGLISNTSQVGIVRVPTWENFWDFMSE